LDRTIPVVILSNFEHLFFVGLVDLCFSDQESTNRTAMLGKQRRDNHDRKALTGQHHSLDQDSLDKDGHDDQDSHDRIAMKGQL
jgi:hypothetical protein